jgi:predicted translin family RNA/ssDNA-binding protein
MLTVVNVNSLTDETLKEFVQETEQAEQIISKSIESMKRKFQSYNSSIQTSWISMQQQVQQNFQSYNSSIQTFKDSFHTFYKKVLPQGL